MYYFLRKIVILTENKLQYWCFSVNIAKRLFYGTPAVAASGNCSIVLDPETISKQNLTSKTLY